MFNVKYNKSICREVAVNTKKLLGSRNFVKHLVAIYPAVAAKFSLIKFDNHEQYRTMLFTEFMANTDSHLYQELRNDAYENFCENRYTIDPSSIVLNFYLLDIKKSIEAEAHKYIGNYILDYIEQQTGIDNVYQQAVHNGALWQCPIDAAITFFDIMILERLYQLPVTENVYVRLNCMEEFSEKLLAKLRPVEDIDINSEYPTQFHYLLYRCVEVNKGWIKALIKINSKNNLMADANVAELIVKYFAAIIHQIIDCDNISACHSRYLEEMLYITHQLDSANLQKLSAIIVDCVFTGQWLDDLPQPDYRVVPSFASKLKRAYGDEGKGDRALTFQAKYKEKISVS